jgi:hypothetical protein
VPPQKLYSRKPGISGRLQQLGFHEDSSDHIDIYREWVVIGQDWVSCINIGISAFL